MDRNKIIEWLFNGETGISSKTMASAFLGVYYNENRIFRDPDDFSRCFKFAEYAELTKEDLAQIGCVYPYWKPYLEKWDKFCELYKNRQFHKLYDLIQQIRNQNESKN